jgi:hydrogenase maturation factor
MNLIYAEIIDLTVEGGMQIGSVRVSGAIKKVPLDLIIDAKRGDKVLLCDGVAIGKVEQTNRHSNHVSGPFQIKQSRTSHEISGRISR